MTEMLKGNYHVTELCMLLHIMLLFRYHSNRCPKIEIYRCHSGMTEYACSKLSWPWPAAPVKSYYC